MLETPGSSSESNEAPSILVPAVLVDNTCRSFLSTIGWLGSVAAAAAASASRLVGCSSDGEEALQER